MAAGMDKYGFWVKTVRIMAVLALVCMISSMGPAKALAGKEYRYYPEADVYFDLERQGYFYMRDGSWQFGFSLPDRLKLKLGSFELIIGDDKPYRRHAEHVKKYRKGGPPPHAPAHGYRRKFRYYPNHRVYYDTQRRVYFYLSAGAWTVSVSLPQSLRIDLGGSITLSAPADRPYLENPYHVKKYPPGQLKKQGGGKSGHIPPGQAKKNNQGKGHGKGKGKNK